MFNVDIFYFFIFVLSILYTINTFIKIVRLILSETPTKIYFNNFEKIFNYFFFTYLITYITIIMI